jgi:hypothetical protein
MSLYLSKEAGAIRTNPVFSPALPWRLPQFNAPPPMQPPPTMTTVSRSAPPPPSPWPMSARRPGVNEAGAIPYAIPASAWNPNPTPIGPQINISPTFDQRLAAAQAANPKEQAFIKAVTTAMANHTAYVPPPLVLTPAQQANLAIVRQNATALRAYLSGARGLDTGAGALIPQAMAMNVQALHAGKGARSRNGAWALAAQAGMLEGRRYSEAGAPGVVIGQSTGTDAATLASQLSSAQANYNALLASISAHPATDSATLAAQQSALLAAAGTANTLASQLNTVQAASVGEGGTAPAPPALITAPTLSITDATAPATTPTAVTTSTPVATPTPLPPAVEPPPTSSTATPSIVSISTPVTTPATTAPANHSGMLLAAGGGALLAFLYFGRNKKRGR